MFHELTVYLENNSLENLFNVEGSPELKTKAEHIRAMTEIAMQIADKDASLDKELLRTCCLHHDDGRVAQFKLIGNFNDRVLSHNALGLDMLDRYISANNVSITPAIQILRACIYYHGRLHLTGYSLDPETAKYVQIVSDADDIENGCIGAIGYLAREVETDAKDYRKVFPLLDRTIKPELFEFYRNGQWFNKIEHCKSYAEYILFAATLAMKSIKKYGDIAKSAMKLPCYGYNSAVDGYIDLFNKYMSPADASLASQIMLDMFK